MPATLAEDVVLQQVQGFGNEAGEIVLWLLHECYAVSSCLLPVAHREHIYLAMMMLIPRTVRVFCSGCVSQFVGVLNIPWSKLADALDNLWHNSVKAGSEIRAVLEVELESELSTLVLHTMGNEEELKKKVSRFAINGCGYKCVRKAIERLCVRAGAHQQSCQGYHSTVCNALTCRR